jgi:hypothetical protein
MSVLTGQASLREWAVIFKKTSPMEKDLEFLKVSGDQLQVTSDGKQRLAIS